MSLATRCTSCGTIFRVVQDQLKVSEGWVRCGRCDAVFNAAEGLFDLEREAPPAWEPAQAQAPSPAAAEPAFHSTYPDAYSAEAGSRGDRDAHETSAPGFEDAPPGSRTALPDSAPSEPGRYESAESLLAADEIVIAADATNADATNADATNADPWRWSDQYEAPVAPASSAAEAAPGFVQRARREAFWQSRRARVLLWTAAVLLLAALSLQGAQHFSELAAARWPATRPVLSAWCGLTGCSLAAPHRIDDIVVESTALAPTPGGSALRLAVSLRNRAAYPVAVPSIDLSLTDTAGQLVAKRTLGPRDFLVSVPSLPAGGELPLQVVFSAGAKRITGYTVEIFYP